MSVALARPIPPWRTSMFVAFATSSPPWRTVSVSPETLRGGSAGRLPDAAAAVAGPVSALARGRADGLAAFVAGAGREDEASEARMGPLPLVRAFGVTTLVPFGAAASRVASAAASISAPASVSAPVTSVVSRSAMVVSSLLVRTARGGREPSAYRHASGSVAGAASGSPNDGSAWSAYSPGGRRHTAPRRTDARPSRHRGPCDRRRLPGGARTMIDPDAVR